MIIVDSFIKKPGAKVTSLSDPVQLEGWFLHADHDQMLRVARRLSSYRVEGAISFEVDGVQLLGFRYWDDIDCLWSYLLQALARLLVSGKAEFEFPDQPIQVEMEIVGNGVFRWKGTPEADAIVEMPLHEAIVCLATEGLRFFELLRVHAGPRDEWNVESELARGVLGSEGLAKL